MDGHYAVSARLDGGKRSYPFSKDEPMSPEKAAIDIAAAHNVGGSSVVVEVTDEAGQTSRWRVTPVVDLVAVRLDVEG